MTTVQMLEWFDILQDKSASVYFTEAEKLNFLNNACLEFTSRFFPEDQEEGSNFEQDSNVEQKIGPLIWESNPLTMDASGVITRADLLTDIRTKSGDATCELFKIGAIEFKKSGRRIQCKVLRHNDKAAFEENYFKRPNYMTPKHLHQNNTIQFRPVDVLAEVYITVVKSPVILNTVVNTDLPIDTHNEIVAIALEFAGYASREEILTQIAKTTK